MTINQSSNLSVSNLQVISSGQSVYWYSNVTNSTNINLSGLYVAGSDPNPWNDAGGLNLQHDSNITVTNSTFTNLANGISEGSNTNVTITGNQIYNIENHGIENAGSSYVNISGNSFWNFVPNATDHPDAIIFWTENTTTSATNIVLDNNTITRGTGATIQGIFVQDDSGVLPYLHLEISGNTVTGEGYNGIYIQGSTGAVVSNNVVTPYADIDSRIRIMYSDLAVLTNNIAGSYVFQYNTNLTETGDTTAQPLPVTTAVPTPSGGVQPVTQPSTLPPVQTIAGPTNLHLDTSTDSGVQGDNITNIGQVRIDGTAQAGSSVALFDGTTLIGSGVADGATGAFSVLANRALASGVHGLSVTATDAAGDAATSSLSVLVDQTPAIASLSHAKLVSSSSAALSGSVNDGANVASAVGLVRDGSVVASAMANGGAWSVTDSGLTSKIHTYNLTTTDAAGNLGLGSDTLILGTSGRDTITGGSGANVIVGGGGVDTLTGGGSSNLFVYNAPSDAPVPTGHNTAVDLITNWVSGADHLDLTAMGHLTFGGQTQSVKPYTVEWYVSGGATFVLGDANGNAKADFVIELLGVHPLSNSDFLLT